MFLTKYKVPIRLPPPIFCFENSTVKNLADHRNGIADSENDTSNEKRWKFFFTFAVMSMLFNMHIVHK